VTRGKFLPKSAEIVMFNFMKVFACAVIVCYLLLAAGANCAAFDGCFAPEACNTIAHVSGSDFHWLSNEFKGEGPAYEKGSNHVGRRAQKPRKTFVVFDLVHHIPVGTAVISGSAPLRNACVFSPSSREFLLATIGSLRLFQKP
jgi:hypothetical protein